MISATSLADVVQQRREAQHRSTIDVSLNARGGVERLAVLSPRHFVQPIDGRDAVNVHCVHVVDVVMNTPRHGRELGDHREQQPEIVQLRQHAPLALFSGAHRASALTQARLGSVRNQP